MAQNAASLPFTISSQKLAVSGTTWSQFKTGGLKVIMDNLVAANPALADPTVQATVANTSAASSLPTGTGYQVGYTFVDSFGETLLGSSLSAAFNQANGTTKNTVTLPALPARAQCMNLYLVDPASGLTSIYATGVTGTTFDLVYPLAIDTPSKRAPRANTTGASFHANSPQVNALVNGASRDATMRSFVDKVSNYLSGYPIEWREVLDQVNRSAGIVAAWFQVLAEAEVLIASNPPTGVVMGSAGGSGNPMWRWQLP